MEIQRTQKAAPLISSLALSDEFKEKTVMNIATEFLGEIDRIPGFGSIKTKFLTVMYIPLK